MDSDPLKGRNPFAVARLVRSGNSPCPVCGGCCSIRSTVKGDDVHCTTSCKVCGDVALEISVNDSGDVELAYNENPYMPTFEELEAKELKDSDDRARCNILSNAAHACLRTGKPAKAVSMYKDVTEFFRSVIGRPGWQDAPALCLRSAVRTAEAISGQGDPSDAVDFLEKYRDVAASEETSARVEFLISLSLAHLQSGDPADSVKELRASIDELKDPLPEGDPLIRIRANEALGTILESKPDHTGAMRSFNAAIKECNAKLSEPSEECLSMLSRISGEYAESAYNGKAEKKGTEAIKLAVKTCRNLKDTFPHAYAEALLQRARYLNTVDAIDPGLRDSMDEAISILSTPDEKGLYDRLLPLAYYYRSASSGTKDKLDIDDLAKAYEILRDDLVNGDLPDGVMYSVSEIYVQYLDLFDRPRSTEVRSELAGLGFVFPPAPELKEDKSSE